MEQLYHIKIEYDNKRGEIFSSGFVPCNHKEACILMSKMNKENRRVFLEEYKEK